MAMSCIGCIACGLAHLKFERRTRHATITTVAVGQNTHVVAFAGSKIVDICL